MQVQVARSWYWSGVLNSHTEFENGKKKYEITKHPNGRMKSEAYYKEDKLHRDGNLPALTLSDINGNILKELYFIDGIQKTDSVNDECCFLCNKSRGRLVKKKCEHYFHHRCYVDWYESKRSFSNQKCPTCFSMDLDDNEKW